MKLGYLAFALLLTVGSHAHAAEPGSPAPLPNGKVPAAPSITPPTVASPTLPRPATSPVVSGDKGGLMPPAASSPQQVKLQQRADSIQKQLSDLSPIEQQEVMKRVRIAKPQFTDAQREQMKDQRFAQTQANWGKKTPAERAQMREKMQAGWIKLPEPQKAYQRDKMVERLKALPAEDRKKVMEAVAK